MDELTQFLQANNFSNAPITFDGKLRRFKRDTSKRKKNAWVVAHEFQSSKKLEPYRVVVVGDWSDPSGTKIWKTERKYSREDTKAQKSAYVAAMAAAEKRRDHERAKAKVEAERLWSSGTDAITPYMAAKGIAKHYGTKSLGDILLVPVRRANGELVSIQRIYPDGAKFFLAGGSVAGGWHLIDGMTDRIIVVEGFATGVSVFEATGATVVCAFSAQRLPEVVRLARFKFPTAEIVVGADNDESGAGATWAAKSGADAVVMPTSKGDWNDHASKAKEAFRRDEPLVAQYVHLGHDDKVHYFHVPRADSIIRIEAWKLTDFLSLAPIAHWEKTYPGGDGKILWTKAQDSLTQESFRCGKFNSERVRGAGVWLDDSRVVTSVAPKDSHYIYVSGSKPYPKLLPALSVEESQKLFDACRMFSWEHERSAAVLAGWIALAPICGALPFRPALMLSGSAGSGKSTIIRLLVDPLISQFAIMPSGASTEAGIRQTLKADARPVVFDDFETLDDSRLRQMGVFDLLRASSAENSAQLLKGTPGGHAVAYRLCTQFLFTGIRPGYNLDSDRQRILEVELKAHNDDSESWQRKAAMFKVFTPEYGVQLYSRMVSLLKNGVLLKTFAAFKRTQPGGQRFGDYFGIALAGLHALQSDSAVTDEMAQAVWAEMELDEAIAERAVADHEDCWSTILTLRVRFSDAVRTIEQSVGQLIAMNEQAALLEYGIAFDSESIYISNSHPQLRRLLPLRWQSCWAKSLSRLNGAQKVELKRFGKLFSSRAVKIPRT